MFIIYNEQKLQVGRNEYYFKNEKNVEQINRKNVKNVIHIWVAIALINNHTKFAFNKFKLFPFKRDSNIYTNAAT